MDSDTKGDQPTFDTKPANEDAKERRDSTASSDNSSGPDVDANQGPVSYTLSLVLVETSTPFIRKIMS